MKIAIVGGGPSGLYLAILLKRWNVSGDITVFEQNPKDATYGFGVGVAEGALNQLEAADSESHKAIVQELYWMGTQDIENPDGDVRLKFPGDMGTITRLTLLSVLQAQCDKLSVDVHYEVRIDSLSQFDSYDLIVAADGANSTVRGFLADELGCKRRHLGNRFAWYGFEKALPGALRFRRKGDDVFIAHYYPYTDTMCTFLVEVDEQTWEHNGFGKLSDDDRKAISEDVFSDVLEGGKLIDNKSNWTRFETVENDRWSAGNVTLIGDAQYRAHFSIGSGTRLAMEDAIALATALRDHPGNVANAQSAYEAARRPMKLKLTSAAERSYTWYDNIRDHIDLPIMEFGYNFLTRTGRMPEERLRMTLPDFMEQYDAFRAA